MIESTTRVPELVAALYSTMRTALPEASIVVGTPVHTDLAPDALVIGYPSGDGPSVSTTVERADGLGHRYNETFQVQCLASAVSGETDPAPLIARARAVMAAVETSLKAVRGLGAADLAGLGPDVRWYIGQTPTGAGVECLFSVVGKSAL